MNLCPSIRCAVHRTGPSAVFALAILVSCTAPATAQTSTPQWHWARTDTPAAVAINPTYVRSVVAAAGPRVLWAAVQNRGAIYGQAMYGAQALRVYDTSGAVTTTSTTLTGRSTLIDVQPDGEGGWYLLGAFYDKVGLGSTTLLTRDSFSSTPDHFLMRLDGTLGLRWNILLGKTFGIVAPAIAVHAGGVYVAVDSFDGAEVRRVDAATGAQAVVLKQGSSFMTSVAVDAAGGIYVAGGASGGTMDFAGTAAPIPSSMDYPNYIVRYRPDGSYHWHHFVRDITFPQRQVTPVPGGTAVYYSGALFDSLTIGGVSLSKPAMFGSDYLLARLDSNGAVAWARQLPASSAAGGVDVEGAHHAVTLPDGGAAMLFSSVRGMVDWGSGISDSGAFSTYRTAVVGFSATGTPQWLRRSTGFAYGMTLAGGPAGLHLSGVGRGVDGARFGTQYAPTSVDGATPLVARLAIGGGPATGLGHLTALAGSGLRVWPNPAHTAVHLRLAEASVLPATAVHATLYNAAGQAVRTVVVPAGAHSATIDVRGMARGVYFLQCGRERAVRLVLE